MKWVDYRQKLGIGFDDQEKVKMLKNNILTFVDNLMGGYSKFSCLSYCIKIGELYQDAHLPQKVLRDSLYHCNSAKELISKYIAFYNTYDSRIDTYGNPHAYVVSKDDILAYIKNSLDDLNIQYDILEDNDGIFIFPKGAKELDDSLVSQPLEWLGDYPAARKTYVIALKQYSEGVYIRDVADNLRKSLEDFLREFMGNNNDFNKNKKEVENYLKSQSVDSHLITILCSLLNHYYLLNNEIAKHNDKMDKKYLEYLLYQTGIFIRTLIVVKQHEND